MTAKPASKLKMIRKWSLKAEPVIIFYMSDFCGASKYDTKQGAFMHSFIRFYAVICSLSTVPVSLHLTALHLCQEESSLHHFLPAI